jgi:hypothetical protein
MPNDARQAANDGNSRIINRMCADDICFDSTIRAASTARFFNHSPNPSHDPLNMKCSFKAQA